MMKQYNAILGQDVRIPYKNPEGYADPTAFSAFISIQRHYDRMDSGVDDLGAEVVMNAVKDWRSANRKLDKNPDNIIALETVIECEEFFLSERFTLFTDMDGKALLMRLRREIWG